MTKKRSTRVTMLACAGFAALGLIAGVAPAAAKKKVKFRTITQTQTATVNQCVSPALPIASTNTGTNPNNPSLGVATIPVTLPTYRGLPQDGTVTGVSTVGTRITHSFNNDLSVLLVAPGARTVPLSLSRGGNGNGYGSGEAGCGGSLVRFGDTFGTAISSLGTTNVDPITGDFTPEQPLSGLNGGQARGNWQLLVTDGASGDDGTLDAFSLNFTYTYLTEVRIKVKPKKKK